jgi:hypothetical protein
VPITHSKAILTSLKATTAPQELDALTLGSFTMKLGPGGLVELVVGKHGENAPEFVAGTKLTLPKRVLASHAWMSRTLAILVQVLPTVVLDGDHDDEEE